MAIKLVSPVNKLVVNGSGGTLLDVQGSVGQLFSITDSLTGDLFAVSDISGIPILNVNSSGAVDIDGTLNLGDSDKIQLGASQDLQIYHDGSNSYISEVGTGDLIISADNDLTFKDGSGNIMANMNASNSVELMFGNSKKLETTSTGVTVTGGWVTDGVSVATANVEHTDNTKSLFGNGNDLQIFHNGSNSYIETSSTSTGDFFVTARGTNHDLYLEAADNIYIRPQGNENGVVVVGNGGVTLYYNNVAKLETYATGAGVTGSFYLASGNYVHFDNGVTNNYAIRKNSTNLEFKTGGGYNFLSGNATFAGTIAATNFSGSSSGTNTGDQTLPTDFVSKANGGTFAGTVIFEEKVIIGDNSVIETQFPASGASLHVHETASGSGVAFGDEAHVVISTGAINTGAQGYQGSLWFGSSDHPAGGAGTGGGSQFVWRNAGIASTSGTADTGGATATGNLEFYTNNASSAATKRLTIEAGGNAVFTGTIAATNFSGSSSGTNTGDQTLSSLGAAAASHNHDGRYLRTHSRHSDDLDTINASGVYIWDVSEADDEPTGASDGLLTIKYWDSTNWATASFQDFHNNKLYIKSKQSNTWQTDWAQVWTTDQLTTTNKSNYDTAYTYSQVGHLPLAGGTLTGATLVNAQLAVNSTTVNSVNKLEVHGQARVNGKMMIGDSTISNVPNAAVQLHVKNAGQAGIRLEDSDSSNLAFDVIVDEGVGFLIKETVGGDSGDDIRLTIAESTGAVTIGGTIAASNLSGTNTGDQDLSGYAPLASPALTGTPTAPTAGATVNTTQLATTAFVQTAVSSLVDSAPSTLDTLNELAAALGDDASFSTTVTNSIATKLPLAGGTLTGHLTLSNTNAPSNFAELNIGSSGGGETRAIDIKGSWSANESKSITFTHGSAAGNMVAQINVLYTGSSSKIRWGKFYHGGDSSTYTMELLSTSLTTANLTVSGNIAATNLSGTNTGDQTLSSLGALSTTGKAADSELLDGINSTSFARSDADDTISGKINFTYNATAEPYSAVEIAGGGNHTGLYVNPAASKQAHVRFATNGTLKWQIRAPFQDSADTALKFYSWVNSADKFVFNHDGSASFNGGTVWTSTNDGASSGLDADTVDGLQATAFATSAQGTLATNALPKAGGTLTGALVGGVATFSIVDTLAVTIDEALIKNAKNTNVDSAAAETVITVEGISTYTAAFFDFVIKKGANVRAGTVYSCHDGTNVEFTETSTVDLGDTSDVSLSVDISGTNMRLRATVTSDDWIVKSLVRAI